MGSLISMLIVGLVVGLLARAIKPGSDAMGWVMTIVLGVLGSALGGFLASMLGFAGQSGFMGWVFSIIGAIIILFIYEMVMGRRRLK